ncbi:phosphatidylserine/phosphatidylglycerophosphate/cardiolipin synthase family protein [Gilvimarinus sp. DA14]|uniref:phospholipase D-like domain-containing protein n=1 Tax=Gilvimarinus sp. DA14 TaxID=2956798 RepID=UPI0020B7886E|nr:phospholipase D family protein [Gilvimarinus sp. DA14]UTF61611.1 phospholipase D family protein [Gilvimarinus sp. DA14]
MQLIGFRKKFLRLASLMCLGSGLWGCASAPDRSEVEVQLSQPAPEQAPLVEAERKLRQHAQAAAEHSGVHLLSEGTQAFAARLALVANATQTLDVQYYLFHQDDTGNILSWALWQAAERGVRVRLLLDDMEKRPHDFPLTYLDAHPNITVRMYNPFYWRGGRGWQLMTDFGRLNHRMHNKSLTADNIATIVGGRNVGDEYFAANQVVNFGDMDALLFGPAVVKVSNQFDAYWNSELVYPLALLHEDSQSSGDKRRADASVETALEHLENSSYSDALVETAVGEKIKDGSLPMIWAPVQIWADTPDLALMDAKDSGDALVINRLMQMFSSAEQELFLVSPYFVPRDSGTELLTRKASEGLSVTVITNALAATDVVAVHSGYAKKRDDLLRAGVKLYEVKARPNVDPKAWSISSSSSLHAKTFVVDQRWVFVGSFNLDPRSAWLNSEMGVLIDSPDLARKLLEGVDALLQNIAYEVQWQDEDIAWLDTYSGEVYNTEPNASWWRRAMANVLKIMPVESQL